MSAQPPPLPSPQPDLSSWWVPPSAARPRTALLHGQAVFASMAAALVVIAGVFAWIATHPGKGRGQVAVTLPLAPLSAEPVEEAPLPPPVARPAPRPIVALPAVHRPPREEVAIPPVRETPPPLPPPEPKPTPPPVTPPAPAQPDGQTYGTRVLFLNNPEAAEELAKREKKLLFVMHISGNFEDSCFT